MTTTSPSTAAAAAALAANAPATPELSPGARIRELSDELMLVFVIVMFIKLFVVELYKIPTGSMTPTLLGGLIARVDVDRDGHDDIVYLEHPESDGSYALEFLWKDGKYLAHGIADPLKVKGWVEAGKFHQQSDRILVNKTAYWLHPPRRGDIVVFKVPHSIYRPEAPIYIKRCAGEPGDTITFAPSAQPTDLRQLVVNGKPVTNPPFYLTQRYYPVVGQHTEGFKKQPRDEVTYQPLTLEDWLITKIHVPPDKAYVFGDNTLGSLDSRFWGGVPLENFKGRAFMRLWPLAQFGFLK